MKKKTLSLLLALVMALSLSAPVFAKDYHTNSDGWYVSSDGGLTIKMYQANGTTEVAAPTLTYLSDQTTAVRVYEGAVRMTVTVSGTDVASGSKYIVTMAQGTERPTTSTPIYYINQVTASSGSVTFNVYPKAGVTEGVYTIWVTSNNGSFVMKTATLGYLKSGVHEGPNYVLGDANGDGVTNITDVSRVLQHAAGTNPLTGINLTAADANKDGEVNMQDASRILQHVAGTNRLN